MTSKRHRGDGAPRSCDLRRNRASRTKKLSSGFAVKLTLLLIATASCTAPRPSRAQDATQSIPDFFTPTAYVGAVWDDNLFRLPSGQSVPAFLGGTTRSDFEIIDDVGLRIDKSYGLQRVTVNVDLRQNSYQTYKYLDFVAKNGDATWYWSVTPDVTGHILYTRSQSLNSFTDFTTFGRNIATNELTRFDIDGRIGGAFHVGAAAYQTTQNNTLPVFDYDNTRINSFEPNLNYESAAGNSVGIYGRVARGHYLDQLLDPVGQIDDAFTEHEAGVRLSYIVDGQTNLYGQLGELSRQNSHFASRNFRGLVGQASWQWSFTGKTSGVLTASRNIGAYVSSTSSYVVTTKISVGPQWAATEKTLFSLTADETEYSFKAPIVSISPLRDDHIASLTFQAKWQPLREITLLSSFVHSARHSTFPELEFADNTASATLKVAF